MNICIFSANYLPNVGGVERYTYYTAKELISRGHKVTIVTSNLFNLSSHEIIDGIEIYRLDVYSFIGGRFPVFKHNNLQKSVDKALKSANFDLFIVNARFYFHSLHAMRLAKKNNIKCICIEHGTTHLTVNNRLFDFIGACFEHMLTAADKFYCKNYYGVSQAACQWSGHFGIKSKGVLYNSIDPDEIQELVQNPIEDYKKQLGINEDATVISYTGRLIPEKGVIQLLEAFTRLENKNTALVFAGDGPLYNEIKNRNIPNVFLLGRIDFKHVVALLNQTDVFCLPSRSEGFSTSVLEAVAANCYVITTKTGGTKELISGDDYGTLLDNNDTESVYNALDSIVSDSNRREQVCNNAYCKLLDNFTWKKTADKIEKIILNQK